MDKFKDVFGTSSDEVTQDENVEEATTPEEATEETTEQQGDPETTEVETETVEVVAEEKPASTEAHDEDRKGWIPVDVVLDERAKRKQYEKDLEDVRRQLEEAKNAAQAATNNPDPYDDPDGFRALVEKNAQQKVEEQMFIFRLQMSREQADEKHGDAVVEKATDWAKTYAEKNPAFEAEFYQQRNPFEWIVQQHNRHAMLNEWEADPKAWALKYVQEHGLLPAQAAPAVEAQKQEASNKPPKSIAAVPSATKRTETTDKFDDIFK